jgi:anti-sigma factor RsiW
VEVTRDVVNDLLPVYLAGEGSADTARLVETFLRNDPAFARLVEEERAPELLRRPVVLQPGPEKRALELTKRLIRRQTWFLAFGILFTLLPFTVWIRGGSVTFPVLRYTPLLALAYWLVASLFWAGYARTRWRLRVSGL